VPRCASWFGSCSLALDATVRKTFNGTDLVINNVTLTKKQTFSL